VLFRSLTFLAFPTADPPVHPAVVRNAETLAKFKSYHLKISAFFPVTPDAAPPLVRGTVKETWHSGLRHRSLIRNFYVFSAEGFQPVKESDGQVIDMSFGDQNVRRMQGWDPEHPRKLPLEFGISARDFAEVRCDIALRDPKTPVNADESWSLLWYVLPGTTLEKLAEVSRLTEVPGPEPSITRLRLEASNDPALAAYTGTLIDVDQNHDWLVRRVETKTPSRIAEVVDFQRTPSGFWLPSELRSTLDGKLIGKTVVEEASVNEPMSEDQLTTQFPEGSRVDDSNGTLHLWGKTAPAQTFDKFDAFMKHVQARAREVQSKLPGGGAPSRGWTGGSVLLVGNLLLVAILASLIAVRRRLSRATGNTNP